MAGINITNKKKLVGRNRIPHVARKMQMPPENPESYRQKLDAIDWTDHPPENRSYKIKINGMTVFEPVEREKKTANGPYATQFNFGRYKDAVKKGKWV